MRTKIISLNLKSVLTEIATSGQWLYSEGLSRYGTMGEIVELEDTHKQLHETALRIVRLRSQRDTLAARQELIAFEKLSLKMLSLLISLQQTIG